MSSAIASAPRSIPDSGVSATLDAVAAGMILPAYAAAETLRRRGEPTTAVTNALIVLLEHGDTLARMLSLHALSAAPGRRAGHAILASLADASLSEHGAWALVRRAPLDAAIAPLVDMIARGGFAAMPAQLALERWSTSTGGRVERALRHALARCSGRGGQARLSALLRIVEAPRAVAAPPALRAGRPQRLGVAQVLLRGQVDAGLEHAGSGDGGGVVTQLVQLTRELGLRHDVEQSILIARPPAGERVGDEPLGPGSRIVRLPFGPDEQVATGAMWEHRAEIERALSAVLAASAPIGVAHLRFADAGTFAAARALRRAGVRIVFTLAPDPHALIDDGARTGRLTRASFAAAEADEHNLFRLRLVDDLTVRADQIVTLPRVGGRAEVERLVGRRLPWRRTAEIAEGIALAPIADARTRALRHGAEPRVATDLRSALAGLGRARLDLPLIVSVGRFHAVKGFPRLVEAWGGDAELARSFNLVLVGGDLVAPTPGERAVFDDVEAVAARHPGVSAGLVLLGARRHEDIADLLLLGQQGLAGTVAPGGVYACASAKEEFGVAILEALATGLPVVAPAGGGPGSYIEHGVVGVLVEPGSVEGLRTGLREAARLAADDERSGRAAALVRERFAIEPMAAALARSYRRAVEH